MIEIDIEKINRTNFRNCLTAMSRPGKTYPITPLFDSALQAMASVLLYSEVSYHYNGMLDFQMVAALTGAQSQSARMADYLFFDAPDTTALQEAKAGTPENPEDGANLLFQCDNVSNGLPVSLSGPGVDGSLQTELPVDADFISALQGVNSNFPIGLDLFFIDCQNRILGIPRTTSIEVLP